MTKEGNTLYLRGTIRESFKKSLRSIEKTFLSSFIYRRFEMGPCYRYGSNKEVIKEDYLDYDCLCLLDELDLFTFCETLTHGIGLAEEIGLTTTVIRINHSAILRTLLLKHIGLNKEQTKQIESLLNTPFFTQKDAKRKITAEFAVAEKDAEKLLMMLSLRGSPTALQNQVLSILPSAAHAMNRLVHIESEFSAQYINGRWGGGEEQHHNILFAGKMLLCAGYYKVPELILDLGLSCSEFGFKNGIAFAFDVMTVKGRAVTCLIGGTYQIKSCKFKNICEVILDQGCNLINLDVNYFASEAGGNAAAVASPSANSSMVNSESFELLSQHSSSSNGSMIVNVPSTLAGGRSKSVKVKGA